MLCVIGVLIDEQGNEIALNGELVDQGVSRIDSTTLLILLQHSVLQYFLLYIEQKLHGPL